MLVQKAIRYQQFGELDAAADALKSALEKDPGNSDVLTRLGSLYEAQKAIGKAMECYRKALESDSENLSAYERLGFLKYTEGDFESAVQTLKPYFVAGGSEVDTLVLLAKAAYRLDDWDTVMEATSKIIKINEDMYEAWELRGESYAKKGKFNEACVCLNMAIDLHPASVTALNSVGDLCYEAENYLRAAEFYESSLRVSKKQPEVLFKYGTSLWFLDRWAESIPLLEHYVSLVPEDPRGWNNLGVVLREKGEVTKAIECYRKALKLNPEMEAARTNLETAMKKEVLT